MSQRRTYSCDMCGAPIADTFPARAWHALVGAHDPGEALREEWRHDPLGAALLILCSSPLGAGAVAAIYTYFT